MIYTKMTKKAMKIAYKAHEGQIDKSGLPYIFHPFHVAEQMKDEFSTAAALLHDVVEDTGITLSELEKEGFPEEVLTAVRLLTRKGETSYLDYIREVRTNDIAVAVKLADIAHNSDVSRLDKVTREDRERFDLYAQAMEILKSGV